MRRGPAATYPAPVLNRLRQQKQSRRAILVERASGPIAWLGELDQASLRVLRTRAHGPVLLNVMKGLGFAGEFGAVWVSTGAAGALLDAPRRQRWAAAALVAPAAIVVNFTVKRTVGRSRPLITEHPPLAKAPTNLSFPSTHATSSLAAAGALSRVEPRAAVPLHLLAAAICIGRPYLGMHYPSDVIAGAAFGAVLGRLVPLPAAKSAHEAWAGDGSSSSESQIPPDAVLPPRGPTAFVPAAATGNGSQAQAPPAAS